MKQIHFFAAACLVGLTAVMSCSKELPFPETEDAIVESASLTGSIDLSVREILESAFAEGADVNLKKLAKQMKKIDGVVDSDVYADDDLIVLRQKDGVYINIFLDSFREHSGEGPEPMEDAALSFDVFAPTRSVTDVDDGSQIVCSGEVGVSGKALLLAPMYSEDLQEFEEKWGTEGRVYGTALYQSIIDYLESSGYTVKPLLDNNADFFSFGGPVLADYDVVVIVSEGKKKALFKGDKQYTAIRTGTTVREVETIAGQISNQFALYTDNDWLLMDPYSVGVINEGTYYYFGVPLLEEDTSKLKDSWILAGADYSASKEDLSKALFDAQAGAYTGFDGDMGRMELLSLTSYMTAMMCTGVELDLANEMAKENAKDFKGKSVSGRKKLVSSRRTEGDKFYLYDSSPYELKSRLEDNNSFTLFWKIHPSIAERVCEVIVDGKTLVSGVASAKPNLVYSAVYYPKRKGRLNWHVVSTIQTGDGSVLDSFRSRNGILQVNDLGALDISPSHLEFGTVPFGGDLVSRSFVIENIGDKDIQIESFDYSDGSFSVYYDDSDLILKPGEKMDVGVSFNPIVFGTHSEDLHVKADGETYSIALSAFCSYAGPTMRIEDGFGNPLSVLEFGEVAVGDEMTIRIGLANVSPMTLDAEARLGTSVFELDVWPYFSVSPGWFIPTYVTFRPAEVREYSDALTLRLPEGLSSVQLPIHGKGVSDSSSGDSGLTVSTSVLRFGNVEIGKRKALDVEIRNDGDLPVHVLSTDCPPGFGSGNYDGFWVEAHSSITRPIAFLPEKERHYSGYVSFDTDSGVIRSPYVDGDGVKPANPQGALIMFEPPEIDFGQVKLGGCMVRNVYFTNVGDDGLHISSVSLPDCIQSNLGPHDKDLPAGESNTVEFMFTPSELGDFSGEIQFASNSRRGVETIRYKGSGVTSTVPVSSVSLDRTSLVMYRGEVARLTATVLPANASDKYVTWESSNHSVATVDRDGKITTHGKGTAVITVVTFDGHKKASCSLTVKDSSDGSHEGTGENQWN